MTNDNLQNFKGFQPNTNIYPNKKKTSIMSYLKKVDALPVVPVLVSAPIPLLQDPDITTCTSDDL